MNYRMILQYDGGRYQGWQRQKEKYKDTIQGRLEMVLSKQEGKPVHVHGAGRTDAGVHARGQVAHFHSEKVYTAGQINEYLPEDIRILRLEEASPRFHSRLNATGKVYGYQILKAGRFDVFQRRYAWQMQEELDLEAMKEAADCLTGKHDFAGFCTKASKKKSTVRQIYEIRLEEEKDRIWIWFYGNGFLYNMVRILTGTLVAAGTGAMTTADVMQVLAQKDRKLAGPTAPAQGLFLQQVKYD